ncbi:MAG TPA: hypothetical protein VIY47_07325 [Ignavibacteriaceae bacterium]
MINDLSKSIDLGEYTITYTDFVKWVTENNMDVYAVNTNGGNGMKIFFFNDLEDYTAFTLKFSKRPSPQRMGYSGKTSVDSGVYYAPYIPTTGI